MQFTVNKDILQGKWNQVLGKVKQQWGKLTDDELDRIEGRYDELIDVIQERYGYSKAKATEEVDEFINRLDKSKLNIT